jgi:hypothetical protein
MAELNNSGTGQWSETDANNTSPPPDGAPVGTFPNQAEGIWRAIMGALKRFWDRINGTVTTTGSAGAYVYAPSNTSFPTAYVQGETYVWRANFTSVGGDTLNINALGAKGIYKPSTSGLTAIAAGDIQSGQIVHTVYDANLGGGAGGFQLMSPIANGLNPASLTAKPSPSASDLIVIGDSAASSVAKTATVAAIVALATPQGETVSSQTGGSFSAGTTNNTLYVVSSQASVATLPSAGSSGVAVGFRVGVKNQSDGLAVSIAPQSGDTIDGLASYAVPGRDTIWLVKDSAGSWTVEMPPKHLIGETVQWDANTLPAGGWAWKNGQSLSTSAYGGLFAILGYAYGGSGSSFGVPDERGRLKAGNDAMGGASAANRITSGGSGIVGTTTGAAGGAETVSLTVAQLASHSHGVSDPGHGHGVNDPGHAHGTAQWLRVDISGGYGLGVCGSWVIFTPVLLHPIPALHSEKERRGSCFDLCEERRRAAAEV